MQTPTKKNKKKKNKKSKKHNQIKKKNENIINSIQQQTFGKI